VDDNWRVIKKAYFGTMPPVVRTLLPDLLRRSVRRTIWGQGVSRYTPEELDAKLTRDLEAVRSLMAPEGFFFGERFSSVDCTVFAFLASLMVGDLPKPLAPSINRDSRLTTYVEHVRRRYFATPPGS
jgi:glutathione S-transferase